MSESKNIIRIAIILLVILTVGTLGYILIEKWSFVDSLYMTVITISTVGYDEVHELSNAGKIFSAILIVGGVGAALYAFSTIIDYFLRGRLRNIFGGRHKMETEDMVSKLKNHYILCGYGTVGMAIARRFKHEGAKFVVLDPDPDAVEQATEEGYLAVEGDGSSVDDLVSAGVEKAKGLVVVTKSDATNVFIIVTARKISPDLYIVTRASSEESEMKLEAVGADRAMNPYKAEGERMARLALHPVVSDFLENVLPGSGRDQYLEEIEVEADSDLCGKTVLEAQSLSRGAAILAIRKKGKQIIPKPPDDQLIDSGDRIIILGIREQLTKLEDTAEPAS
ncbi:potassium channel family protein [Chloroflexota bacterium]